ncbi:MAG: radical SAM/SPASM domain-containing protein, partial [Clostridioides sp.]|jgi:uncharacterized protein|nr:radical SAM/SPASM domain-containing protein [Clostridioides sp.]
LKINSQVNEKCDGCTRYENCESSRCKFINKKVTGEYYEPVPMFCINQRVSMETTKKLMI